jgi:hypothetical protein
MISNFKVKQPFYPPAISFKNFFKLAYLLILMFLRTLEYQNTFLKIVKFIKNSSGTWGRGYCPFIG